MNERFRTANALIPEEKEAAEKSIPRESNAFPTSARVVQENNTISITESGTIDDISDNPVTKIMPNDNNIELNNSTDPVLKGNYTSDITTEINKLPVDEASEVISPLPTMNFGNETQESLRQDILSDAIPKITIPTPLVNIANVSSTSMQTANASIIPAGEILTNTSAIAPTALTLLPINNAVSDTPSTLDPLQGNATNPELIASVPNNSTLDIVPPPYPLFKDTNTNETGSNQTENIVIEKTPTTNIGGDGLVIVPAIPEQAMDITQAGLEQAMDITLAAPGNAININPSVPMNASDITIALPVNEADVSPSVPEEAIDISPTVPLKTLDITPAVPVKALVITAPANSTNPQPLTNEAASNLTSINPIEAKVDSVVITP